MIYGMLRKVNFFGFVWILSLAAIGAWIGVMSADNTPPTEYAEVGAEIIPNPVEDGGRVLIKFPIERHRACPGVVQRQLRDANTGKIVAIFDPIPAAQTTLGDQTISRTFTLPEGLPHTVKYQAKVCFACNPFQKFVRPLCVSTPDVVFNVIPVSSQ